MINKKITNVLARRKQEIIQHDKRQQETHERYTNS